MCGFPIESFNCKGALYLGWGLIQKEKCLWLSHDCTQSYHNVHEYHCTYLYLTMRIFFCLRHFPVFPLPCGKIGASFCASFID